MSPWIAFSVKLITRLPGSAASSMVRVPSIGWPPDEVAVAVTVAALAAVARPITARKEVRSRRKRGARRRNNMDNSVDASRSDAWPIGPGARSCTCSWYGVVAATLRKSQVFFAHDVLSRRWAG
jgi:hypothetical protein